MSLPHTIELSGSSRQRGLAYGEGLRDAIRERDRRWKSILADEWKMADPVEAFLGATDYLPAVEKHAPALLEELRGIAVASGLPFEDIFACQLMDEEWTFSRSLADKHHCSALGGVEGGNGFIGQNMDLIDWMDGFQTILKIHDTETGMNSIVLTVAGMIGLCGVNSAGLGLCVNTLSTLRSSTDGLPVAFAARSLLTNRTVNEAASFLQGIPQASGQNFMLADGGAIAGFECSASGCTPWSNDLNTPNRLWHTNHPIANKDQDALQDRDEAAGSQDGSRLRQARLEKFAGCAKPLTIETIKSALSDKQNAPDSICRTISEAHSHGRRGFTFAGVIWKVGENPSAQVTAGPPDTNPWIEIGF